MASLTSLLEVFIWKLKQLFISTFHIFFAWISEIYGTCSGPKNLQRQYCAASNLANSAYKSESHLTGRPSCQ